MVTASQPAPLRRLRVIERSAAQQRVMSAALELFAENGVAGTSLQMIADRVGVTKAAVYHQFPTKDEIVLAVAEREMAPLEEALERAEDQPSLLEARQELLVQVIAMAVSRRRWVRALQNDPVMVRLLAEHQPLAALMQRLYGLLLGDGGPQTRVRIALMGATIGASVVHPLVADLDDDTLRRELIAAARRLFELDD
jgi:AcrR family transcriptional regulator